MSHPKPAQPPRHLARRAWLQGALGLALIQPLADAIGAPLPTARDRRALMGTLVDITVQDSSAPRAQTALAAAYDEMGRLADMMSVFRPGSVVNAINAAAGQTAVPVPPELMRVLQMAQSASLRSGGAFDVTVASVQGWDFSADHPAVPTDRQVKQQQPLIDFHNLVLAPSAGTARLRKPGSRIDLGGIAKLAILDAGMQTLRRHGVGDAMINGGGDVLVMSQARPQPWRVGVRDPRAPDQLLGVLALRQGVVASSGDYERCFVRDGRRYHHVLNPKTGYPATGAHGATLVAERVEQVNGLGAAIMVMGAKAGSKLAGSLPQVDSLIVDQDRSVWMSEGMRHQLMG